MAVSFPLRRLKQTTLKGAINVNQSAKCAYDEFSLDKWLINLKTLKLDS